MHASGVDDTAPPHSLARPIPAPNAVLSVGHFCRAEMDHSWQAPRSVGSTRSCQRSAEPGVHARSVLSFVLRAAGVFAQCHGAVNYPRTHWTYPNLIFPGRIVRRINQ